MNASILRFLSAVAIIAVTLPTSADADAPAGQYVVTAGGTGNGTVYDTKSKLTWQQTILHSPKNLKAKTCISFNMTYDCLSG